MARPDIDLDDNETFEKHNHIAQRTGWALIAVFLIAAAAGLFGQSKYSWTKIQTDGLTLKYSRFVRQGAPTELKLHVPNAGAEERIWISNKFLQNIKIERISPLPKETRSRESGLEFLFIGSGEALEIIFDIEPDQIGTLKGDVARGSNPTTSFSQYAYF